MFCSCCGNDLEEGGVCDRCGWSISAVEKPITHLEPTQAGSRAAIASLVCGIISWSTCGGGFVLPLVGFGLGIFGLRSQRSDVAMVGVILNAMVFVVFLLSFVLLVLFALMTSPDPSVSTRCC